MAHRREIRKIMTAINIIDGIYSQVAKEIGISENTLALIYALDDEKHHSQVDISREWLIPKTTLNSIVMDFISKGYIKLVPEEHTKEKLICLTEDGKKYAESVLRQIYFMEEKAFCETLLDSENFAEDIENFAQGLKKELKRQKNMNIKKT